MNGTAFLLGFFISIIVCCLIKLHKITREEKYNIVTPPRPKSTIKIFKK